MELKQPNTICIMETDGNPVASDDNISYIHTGKEFECFLFKLKKALPLCFSKPWILTNPIQKLRRSMPPFPCLPLHSKNVATQTICRFISTIDYSCTCSLSRQHFRDLSKYPVLQEWVTLTINHQSAYVGLFFHLPMVSTSLAVKQLSSHLPQTWILNVMNAVTF